MRSIEDRIPFYTKGQLEKNFGDYLADFFFRKILVAPLYQDAVYRLIGSVISDSILEYDLNLIAGSERVVYWCCGLREAHALSVQSAPKMMFAGVRGPLTRQILGLDETTPIGDPALLMPLVYSPSQDARTTGQSVCIPHFSQRHLAEELRVHCKADAVLSPAVTDDSDLLQLIDDIAAAEFVLSGSLHGAIIAAAYGRPFAFWDTGFVDVPFKWQDFAASLGVDMPFVTTMQEGWRLFPTKQSEITLPKLLPILGCCPFSVRFDLLRQAILHDSGALSPQDLLSNVGTFFNDRDDVISFMRRTER